jgi:hypothetical protein
VIGVAEKTRTDSGLVAARPVASSAVVRWGAWAGIVYVLAWLIWLFLAPSAPDAFGSAGTINAYFSSHRSAALVQAVFIPALAGVALLGLTAALWSFLAAGETAVPRRVMLAAGVVAAAVSFLQVAFMIAIYVHVGQHGSAEGTRTLFNAINKADTIKLILLAVFVGAASWAASRNGALPRWVVWLGAVTVVFLVVGGLAFLAKSAVLNVALDISLPLLLLWAAAASVSMLWRRPVHSQSA